MALPAILGALLPTALSWLGQQGVFGGTGGGTKEVSQGPMLTPEQQAALKQLLGIGQGPEATYTGSFGEFAPTGIEQAGLGKLEGLLGSGMPEMFGLGQAEIKKLLTTSEYDPYSETGVYKGMKRNILREGAEQQDILNREAARMGKLSSTWRGQETGLLGERTQSKLSDILANLYDIFAQRKLGGAQTAATMGLQEEGINLGRIGASQQYGGLERWLKTEEAKAKYSDWQRARGEKLDALSRVSGIQVPYGVSKVPVYQENPWTKIVNQAIMGFGGYLQNNPNIFKQQPAITAGT